MFALESTEIVVDFPEDDQFMETSTKEIASNDANDDQADDKRDQGDYSSAKAGEETPEFSSTEGGESEEKPEIIPFEESVILKNIAKEFESEGLEIEVSENENSKEFISKLRQKVIEKELSDPESPVYNAVKGQILDEQGIDDRILSIAAGIPFGVNREEYVSLLNLKEYAESQFDVQDIEGLKELFATYHTLKGISDDDIDTYIDADLKNISDDLVEKRKRFIYDSANTGLKEINDFVEKQRNIQKEHNNNIVKQMNSFIKKGEVAGYSFTKDEFDSYIKAITVKDQEISLPDGSKRKVTAIDKKRYERQLNDYESAVLDDMLFFFDKDSSVKNKKQDSIEKKTAGSFMKNMASDMSKYNVPAFKVQKNTSENENERIVNIDF